MAWNEPGNGSGDGKDPWSGNRKQSGPPDLDKVLKDFQKKVKGLLGGGPATQGSDGQGSNDGLSVSLLLGLLLGFLAIWAVFGFYVVSPGEQGVVLRFGEYVETVDPGLHWLPPLVERKFLVDVAQKSAYTYASDMLTSDENIVSVEVAVQYRRQNPEQFLFNVVQPLHSLEQVSASALRQVIGDNDLDYILTAGKDQIQKSIFEQITELQQKYKTGIEITNVSLLSAKPPAPVEDAFDDVIKSREDKERYVDQARAYSSKVVPEAEGRALRTLADAEAYQQDVVLNARGETARFTDILPEYLKAPKVTRERMYIAAIEQVMQNSNKVLVDVQHGNNMMYIPLDRIINRAAGPQTEIINQVPMQQNHQTTTNSRTSNKTAGNSTYLNIAKQSRSERGRGNY